MFYVYFSLIFLKDQEENVYSIEIDKKVLQKRRDDKHNNYFHKFLLFNVK